ncbi:hypothetical protein HNR06_002472 [Nocardiopsis arvandica]|uniref:Uncharacterized protein n=1 Tax=Nocardiopsis sinuspersici TaxID=501010 RepID=A0A7Y9XBZ0_9ACTN|nr:hypothetical protein [Nocardiopsis sinuspersici]
MTHSAEMQEGSEGQIGQEGQNACCEELIGSTWSDPQGRRRPILVVHGPQGYGKSHFVLYKARDLEMRGIPYAHLDFADTRYNSSVTDVFAAVTSHQETGLARALRHYGRLQFPRLWTALITIRLDLDVDEGQSDEGSIKNRNDRAHARISDLVDQVWPSGLVRLGRLIGEAGSLLPPAGLVGGEALSVDIARWITEVSEMGTRVLDRVFEWFRSQGQGTQAREQVTDSLYHLWFQAQDPDAVDVVSRISNREKMARFLSEALFADLQHASWSIGHQPTPVLLLDNTDRGVGPVVLRALAQVPPPSSRSTFFGGAGFPEPLTIVATAADTVSGVLLEHFYEDVRQHMRFLPLTPMGSADIGRLFSLFGGDDHVSGEIADLLADFTGGHPGTTAQLVEAWIAVGGGSLHAALHHRPRDPFTRTAATMTVEERMFEAAFNGDPDQLDHRLREALITCSAARDPDAGLWLNRWGGLTERVEEERLLAHPLWDQKDPGTPTVLRRLLSRNLARRPTSVPGHWEAVHSKLADYYRSEGADSQHSAEYEIHHRLCAGQFAHVTRQLQKWFKDPDIGGQEWVRLLRTTTSAPLRTPPPFSLVDAWVDTWQKHAASEGLRTPEDSEETEVILKLVVARHILHGPEPEPFDPERFCEILHSSCHSMLNDLGGRIPWGATSLFEEAAWHMRMATRYGRTA